MEGRCKVVDCKGNGGWELILATPIGDVWVLLCQEHRIEARETQPPFAMPARPAS
jgi:hypothetical protein